MESEIALYINPVVVEASGRVTWAPPSGLNFTYGLGPPSIADYRQWLLDGQYSAVLRDGSLLQVTYDFDASGLAGHRLCFVPAPAAMDEQMLLSEPLVDVLDFYLELDPRALHMATPLRFDYAPQAAGVSHPIVHLTLNAPDCRIPVVAPLRLGDFVHLVFSHFYPKLWRQHPFLADLPRKPWGGGPHISSDESEYIHLSWLTHA